MNVLIADDDRITRESLARYVDWRSLGFDQVICAKDGRDALEQICTCPVDILVTDIRMPYLTGFELVNAAGNRGHYPATIIISGYDDYDYLQQAIRLHIIQGYIFKPIDLDQFIQQLKGAIRFREEWIRETKVPELTDAEQTLYSYKDLLVNLQNVHAVTSSLLEGDYERSVALFDQSWKHSVSDEKSLNYTKRFAWEFVISLMQSLAKNGISTQEIAVGVDPLTVISALTRKEDVYAHILDMLDNVNLYLSSFAGAKNPKIEAVVDAIENRFSDPDLSLQSLAQELHVSANYLGSLYKKESPRSFNSDLLARRMKEAKKLLTTTEEKIQDISAKCGFADPKYFAVLFKKELQMTPRQYRTMYFGHDPERE